MIEEKVSFETTTNWSFANHYIVINCEKKCMIHFYHGEHVSLGVETQLIRYTYNYAQTRKEGKFPRHKSDQLQAEDYFALERVRPISHEKKMVVEG